MCRWFAYISPTEPCLLEDVLINPKHALCRQVYEHFLPGLIAHEPKDYDHQDQLVAARNSVYNIDGLGIAWYTASRSNFVTSASGDALPIEGLRAAAYKTVCPPLHDINFRSICGNTETRVLFAHIRASSATPVVAVNNHPFIFGRHTFMHNGTIMDFERIKRPLCAKLSDAAFAGVMGGTDSEHFAALYLTYLTSGGDKASFEREYPVHEMAAAMQKANATVITLQQEALGPNAQANSLNMCATDGIRLVAQRFRNHASEQPPSLYYSTKAGTTLNRKYPDTPDDDDTPNRWAGTAKAEEHGKHLIVASEPSTYKKDDWHLIGKNQCLMAGPDGKFELCDVPYKKEWDGGNPSA